MRFDHPFTTYLGCETDPKFNGAEAEIEEYITRENLIHKFLSGEIEEDAVFDCLDQQGIDPYEYIDSVEYNVNFIIQNQILISDAGLWLPQY